MENEPIHERTKVKIKAILGKILVNKCASYAHVGIAFGVSHRFISGMNKFYIRTSCTQNGIRNYIRASKQEKTLRCDALKVEENFRTGILS